MSYSLKSLTISASFALAMLFNQLAAHGGGGGGGGHGGGHGGEWHGDGHGAYYGHGPHDNYYYGSWHGPHNNYYYGSWHGPHNNYYYGGGWHGGVYYYGYPYPAYYGAPSVVYDNNYYVYPSTDSTYTTPSYSYPSDANSY